jgi:hypothetical protein
LAGGDDIDEEGIVIGPAGSAAIAAATDTAAMAAPIDIGAAFTIGNIGVAILISVADDGDATSSTRGDITPNTAMVSAASSLARRFDNTSYYSKPKPMEMNVQRVWVEGKK